MNNSLRGEIDQELFRLWSHATLGGYADSDHPYVQKWIKHSSEQILSLVESKMPEWKHEAYYTKHPVIWKPVAPEGNAEHYAAGFNQAIESVKSILRDER